MSQPCLKVKSIYIVKSVKPSLKENHRYLVSHANNCRDLKAKYKKHNHTLNGRHKYKNEPLFFNLI